MKKQILKVLSIITLLISMAQMTRVDASNISEVNNVNEISDFIFNADNQTITAYQGNDIAITVPSQINGIDVKKIGDKCFESKNIVSVTLPEGIIEIGTAAFKGCSSLQSINLPDTIKVINNSAFFSCTHIKSISFPSSLETIGEAAFYKCTNTLFNDLPNGLKTLDAGVFYGCQNIISFTIPASVTTLKDNLFRESSIQTIFLPKTLTHIGNNVFYKSNLQEIDIPNAVMNIGGFAFAQCSHLSKVSLPKNLKTIGNYAFQKTNLLEIIFPNSVTSIGNGAFQDCHSLSKVTFSKNLKTIGSYAFQKANLSEIILPEGLLSIGTECFLGQGSQDGTLYNVLKTITLPSTLESIGDYAFNGNPGLSGTITIPKALKEIPTHCFSQCKSIESIIMSDNVQKIGDFAFFDCENLKTIQISQQLKEIGNNAFVLCQKLENISFPASLQTLGKALFSGCTNLKSLTIPNSVNASNSNFSNMFNDCNNLEWILFMCESPTDAINPLIVDPSNGAQLSLSDNSLYRGITTLTQNKDSIELIEGTSLSLNNILRSTQSIYVGKTGMTLSTNSAVQIPETYNKIPVFTINGQKRDNTKILNNVLYIADGENQNLTLQTSIGNIPIYVQKKQITDLKIKDETFNEYIEDETYNPTDLTFVVSYNNGITKEINYNDHDFQISQTKLSLGNNIITFTYNGFTVKQTVHALSKFVDKTVSTQQLNVKGVLERGSKLQMAILDKIPFSINDNNKDIYAKYDISIIGEYKGLLTLSFQIDPKYNGQKFHIYHQRHDLTIETFEKKVNNGIVEITTDELSPFIIAFDKESQDKKDDSIIDPPIIINSDQNIKTNPPITVKTNDQTNILTYPTLLGFACLGFYIAFHKHSKKQ